MASTLNKKIGLLGGSFDPAHKGHLGISKIAIKKLKLKKVYWVVTKKILSKKNAFLFFRPKNKKSKKKYLENEKKIQSQFI